MLSGRLAMPRDVMEDPMENQNSGCGSLSVGYSAVENGMRCSCESFGTAWITKWCTLCCVCVVLRVGISLAGHICAVANISPGWKTMRNGTETQDAILVQECLSGSEKAWNEFYCRFLGLVKSIVKRQHSISFQDIDDVIQSVFTALIKGLKDYDRGFPLARFVCLVTERVCIQDYRRVIAAKRDGETQPIDHHDSGKENVIILTSQAVSQEKQLEQNQLLDMLKRSMRRLGSACRELLRLRYFEELPYKEITKILGVAENTLTVRTKRCLDDLVGQYDELVRRGSKK